MIALLDITALTLATLFALAAATGFHWLFLRAALHLMRPAAARPAVVRAELAHGTARLTRAFVGRR